MKIVPDLSGEVFGELLILRKATPEECIEYGKAEKTARKGTFYWWKCSCGNMGISNRQDLLSGRAKSCGCFKRRQAEKEAESLIGKRYGRLTITGYELKARLNNPKRREIYYHCKCDCGNEIVTTKNNLKSGGTQSCGCQSKEKRQKYVESIKIDLTRKKFGRLTVIKQSDKHGDQRQAYWECICDCGSKTTVLGQQLRLGETQSCGCLLSGGEEKISSLLSMVGIDFKREQTFSDFVNEKIIIIVMILA